MMLEMASIVYRKVAHSEVHFFAILLYKHIICSLCFAFHCPLGPSIPVIDAGVAKVELNKSAQLKKSGPFGR